MNKKLFVFNKKLSLLKVSRTIIQLVFLYFFSSIFTLAFTGFKSIYIRLIREEFSLAGSFTFLAAFVAVFALSILIGRFFCGWLCAFGTFNDYVYLISSKIFKKKFRVTQAVDEKLKYIKYIVLLGIIIFIWSMNLAPKNTINPWDAFAQLPQIVTMAPQIPIAFIFLALITIGAMFIERFFCRYFCPLGAILSISSKFRIMKISKPSEKCGNCQLCTRNCPMGINLSKVEVVDSGECISCLKCVDVCHRSNPRVVVFKKINLKWYSAAITAILLFSLIFFGKKFLKTDIRGVNKASAAQISGVDKSIYNDGAYIGVGTGFRPNLKVEVKIVQGRISHIQLISHEETKGYYEQAFDIVSKEIIASQSTEVDTVSGATKSSNGIKEAVKDALNKARRQGVESEELTDSETKDNTGESKLESLSEDISMDKNLKFKDGTYTGTAAGYQPGLMVSVTVKNGKISDVQIISNNETPGFREKAFSVIPKKIIAAQSIDVDVVSGATFSSRGIIAAVKNALNKAIISGELPVDNVVSETSANNNKSVDVSNTIDKLPEYVGDGLYKDGVYFGTGTGFQPNLKVSVTVKDRKIAEISVVEHNETPGFYEKAFSIIPKEIISKQNTDVDTVSGATRSSNGIILAVNDALKNAKLDGGTESNNNVNNSENNSSQNNTPDNNTIQPVEDSPISKISSLYKDGRYTGIGKGRRNNLIVDVTVGNGKITNISLISYRENLDYMKKAIAPMSEQIIATQSTDVDIVSGATETSNGIKEAVNNALKKAVYKDGIFTGAARGYNRTENLNVNVTIKDGKITIIDLVSQAETASYFQQVWPVIPNEIIKLQSTAVDTVSGATRSSTGIINAVKSALAKGESVGETSTYPGQEEVIAPFRDGVYTGKANGYKENLNVIVTIKNNKILNIDVGPNNETESYFKKAWTSLSNEIIEKQSSDVDAVSGATRSSIGIINAVKDALRQSKLALSADPVSPYKDGTYRGVGIGYKAGLNVDVTVKDNKITSIELGDNNETPAYFEKAWLPVSTAIIQRQLTTVDTISGATRSSNGIMEAVKDALRNAHDATLDLGNSV